MGRGHRTTRTANLAAALLLAGFMAGSMAGCTGPGNDEARPGPAPAVSVPPSDGDGAATPDRDPSDPAPTATETASGPPFPADTRPDTADPTGEGETFLTVTDVRVATHRGYDRVVLDLDGTGSGTPGWRVGYVDRATDDGSGDDVQVDGDAILSVSVSGTAAPTDSGVAEFSGDRIEPEDTESVEEIVYRYWFEGYTTAFLGIDDGERPFRVFLQEDPVRVVIDVQH
ncbi:hypothetical protein ACFQHV_24015 [Promicromonospora thailandica]|uniref:AMIN-like domain-containing protein n=1 Tax=Promicromonospora thailandica TaxID=765201 RepID=A0A9X2JUB3_9MICO|nr:hypothetical protein [Promicromonospora thailandica]MCP2264345.1 hypothetical protein [Promicromonospora thailandica]BFF20964.1 hypothetical protein GCM10025730_44850 [Promicromonospora thailandica]